MSIELGVEQLNVTSRWASLSFACFSSGDVIENVGIGLVYLELPEGKKKKQQKHNKSINFAPIKSFSAIFINCCPGQVDMILRAQLEAGGLNLQYDHQFDDFLCFCDTVDGILSGYGYTADG
ncbi:unnamed protein product [Ceratitis capitata]|uniref:(Mediterranean fruit fly) hypothetical protein n=1 Tax=Ceratitis capitata TaxID=7213 RepID=A0A811UR98_CERCA|nr:unnamed protein product [Ceratitis capitata]